MRSVVKKVAVLVLAGAAALLGSAGSARASELDLTGSQSCTGTACGGTFSIGTTQFWDFAGLLWSVSSTQPTGSGYIDSFVRIQDAGPEPGSLVVDGHNTSGSLVNDEKPGPTFTHDVKTSDLQATTINGVSYYQFLLDINQTGSDPLISLSGLEFCTSGTAGLSFKDTCAGTDNNTSLPGDPVNGGATGSSTLRYDMQQYPSTAGSPVHDQSTNPVNNVKLDYSLNSGSGSGDLFVYVPTAILPTNGNSNKYLYLWSQFGLPSPYGNNDGYEEWAFIHRPGGGGVTPDPFNLAGTPEPATLVMLGTGLLIGGGVIRRRNRRQSQASQQ